MNQPGSTTCSRCGAASGRERSEIGRDNVCPRCLFGVLKDLPLDADTASEGPASHLVDTLLERDTGRSEAVSPRPSEPIPDIPHYEILGVIGRGGMGIVYKARQEGLDRLVAVKVLRKGEKAEPDAVERFLREARSAARLQHPHIVPIHEVSVSESRLYYSMDYIEGTSLDVWAQAASRTPEEIAQAMRKIALALQLAHESGVVHRDLKPGNILVDRRGEPRITDFGVAIDFAAGAGRTEDGITLGTPAYMSPEQAAGESRKVGPLCDVYSLGAVLYECLTGRMPFSGESAAEILRKVIASRPPAPRELDPSVPPELEAICLRAIEKEPGERYASAQAIADDLDRFLKRIPAEVRSGKTSLGWAALAVGVLALVVLIVFSFRNEPPVKPETSSPTDLSDSELFARRLREGDVGTKKTAVEALIDLGRSVARDVVPLLGDPDPEVRGRSAEVLGEIGAVESAGALVDLLEDPDTEVRRRAAQALEDLDARAELPRIVEFLAHPLSGVRRRAGKLLAELRAREAVPEIVMLLDHSDEDARASALEALGRLGARGARQDVARLLEDEEMDVRAAAATTLAELGAEDLTERIEPLLRDEDAPVRAAAARALGLLGAHEALSGLLLQTADDYGEPRDGAEEALLGLGVDAATIRATRAAGGDPVRAATSGTLAWSRLNALRRPVLWEELRAHFPDEVLEGTRREVWKIMVERASVSGEFPTAPSPKEEAWMAQMVKVAGGETTLLEALSQSLEGGAFEFVLERDRIRILRRPEAIELWKKWWESAGARNP